MATARKEPPIQKALSAQDDNLSRVQLAEILSKDTRKKHKQAEEDKHDEKQE